MYQVGELGDCFHLQFTEGQKQSDILIDCGSFRNSQTSKDRLKAIVQHIKSDLNGKKFDAVVGTHQHNDHVSGYVHCESEFNGHVDQVWLSWLDNPKDALARRIKEDQKNLVSKLQAINKKMQAVKLGDSEVLTDVLGFYGIDANNGDPVIPAQGIENLKKMGDKPVNYLLPGDHFDLPGLSAGEVKVYSLGPPRDQTLLFDINPKKDESYDARLAIASLSATKLLSALDNRGNGVDRRQEEQFPFNQSYKKTGKNVDRDIFKIYNDEKESWRKIDLEWLEQANRLALYLDSYTNNSSLVLAFELVKSGRVLFFAADAQTGNWLSWENIKWKDMPAHFSSNSLLASTVLYKVGHHASHNATLVAGLEAMTSDELVAMIPVDKSDPNITKKNGWKMPAKNLFQRLKEKTQFRVLRMDDFYAEDCDPVKNKAQAKWNKLPFKPKEDKKNFFIEYTVQG